jgi:hypothetical protein
MDRPGGGGVGWLVQILVISSSSRGTGSTLLGVISSIYARVSTKIIFAKFFAKARVPVPAHSCEIIGKISWKRDQITCIFLEIDHLDVKYAIALFCETFFALAHFWKVCPVFVNQYRFGKKLKPYYLHHSLQYHSTRDQYSQQYHSTRWGQEDW